MINIPKKEKGQLEEKVFNALFYFHYLSMWDTPCLFLSPCVVITALDMDAMVNTVKGWMENPVKFARSHGVTVSPVSDDSNPERDIHILIIEGFLLYNYK